MIETQEDLLGQLKEDTKTIHQGFWGQGYRVYSTVSKHELTLTDLSMLQNKIGYAVQGYGSPHIIHQFENNSGFKYHSYITIWGHSASCD